MVRAKRAKLVKAREYLTGGEQKALRYLVGLVGEELVQLAGDLHGGLAQSQQWYIDAIAQYIPDHHLCLAGDGAAEELPQVLLLSKDFVRLHRLPSYSTSFI